MASVKVKFRQSTVSGQEGSIYYQILHGRKPRQLPTDYKIFPEEWDDKREKIVTRHDSFRRLIILSIREQIHWDVKRLNTIARTLEVKEGEYTSEDVIEAFRTYKEKYSIFRYMEKIIIKLKQNGQIRTSETYTSALNSFKKFRKDDDMMLDCVNSEIMESYEAWLKRQGLIPNSISFYNRILRAVYNRAVDEEAIENRNPFRRVYTGVDKTVKRALALPMISKIRSLDLSLTPDLDFARDIFMLSFMLRGMSFVDMAYLKKTDMVNGYIVYRRRKTGQQLIIAWTEEMQKILNKYPVNPTQYLFPIITNPKTNERTTYRNKGYNINRSLKKIAQMVGAEIPLTLYVARHSWASAAKAKGIPVRVISEGMGHDSEQTTQIYLASLDTSVVDKANSLILASLQ